MNTAIMTRSILVLALIGFGVVLQQQRAATPPTEQATANNSGFISSTPVTLPTITVRPSAEEIAAAMNGAGEVTENLHSSVSKPTNNGSVTMPRLSWDMPYYSFGHVLSRVAKD